MPWIQSHTNVERHRKTLEMAADLNLSPVHLSGHLHAFWHAVLEQQEDGNLERWQPRTIAQVAGWDGNPEEFVGALRKHGWLDGNLVHDWLDYAGRYLQNKYHSSDPEKLQRIRALHDRQTKGDLKEAARTPEGGQYISNLISSSDSTVTETVQTSEKRGDARGEGTEFALQPDAPVKTKKEKLPTVVPPLPSWLPRELWQRFKDFRKEIKAPMSADAEKLGIDNLTKLVEIEGEDPKAVIEQSIFRRWKGLFKVDQDLLVAPRRGFDKSDAMREKTRQALNMTYDDPDKKINKAKGHRR